LLAVGCLASDKSDRVTLCANPVKQFQQMPIMTTGYRVRKAVGDDQDAKGMSVRSCFTRRWRLFGWMVYQQGIHDPLLLNGQQRQSLLEQGNCSGQVSSAQ